MDLVRIGSKLISRSRIIRRLDEILQMRVSGKSQQETAEALGVDRSFISRLEALGEVRKGGRVALIGFPIENKAELEGQPSPKGSTSSSSLRMRRGGALSRDFRR